MTLFLAPPLLDKRKEATAKRRRKLLSRPQQGCEDFTYGTRSVATDGEDKPDAADSGEANVEGALRALYDIEVFIQKSLPGP